MYGNPLTEQFCSPENKAVLYNLGDALKNLK